MSVFMSLRHYAVRDKVRGKLKMIVEITNRDEQKYDGLAQLFKGYFFPYWQQAFVWQGAEPTYEAVLRHYKTEDSAEGIKTTTAQLEEILSLPLTDGEFKDLTNALGFNCYSTNETSRRVHLESFLEVLKAENNAVSLTRI